MPREDPGMEEWATERLTQVAMDAADLQQLAAVQDDSD